VIEKSLRTTGLVHNMHGYFLQFLLLFQKIIEKTHLLYVVLTMSVHYSDY